MNPPNASILSLSLSRNRLGFCVFRHGDLDYYAGRTLNRYGSTRDRNRAVQLLLDELVGDHGIGRLALPNLNKQQRHSSELRSLYAGIRRFCAKNGITVEMQDPVEMRRTITGFKKPSKANVLTCLIDIFPELKRYSRGETEWERRYYGHIFTAIGSGLVAAGLSTSGSSEGVIE